MRNILITGGSRGIGRESVLKFAEKDTKIYLNFLNNYEAAKLTKDAAEKKGAKVILLPFDVSDSSSVKNNLEDIEKIDVLINNAGVSLTKLFQFVNDKEWERLWNVNVSGTIYVCREIVPKMIKEKNGIIINMSSIWGIAGGAMEVHYSATKGAIIAFTKALAKELAPSGIRVNAVAPGAIKTDMVNLKMEDEAVLIEETPLQRLGTPYEIASLIYYLSSNSASFITGQIISPNGGIVI